VLFTGQLVVVIDDLKRLQDMAALRREVFVDVHELPPRMRQAVGNYRLEFGRSIAGQGIAHLDRRRQVGRTAEQNIPKILAGMLSTVEEHRDPPAFARRHHAGREQSRALQETANPVRS